MRIAIVGGTGDLGFGLALRLARAGEHVVIGSRRAEKAAEAVARAKAVLGDDAPVEGAENAQAVAGATVAFVTVPYEGQAATYKALEDVWPDDIVICDTTTPLATAIGEGATQVIHPWQGSAAEQAASHIADHIALVSGFHTVSAEVLEDLDHDPDLDVLLCGKRAEAKATIGALVEAMGMRWVDCGPITMARILEPITALLIRVNRTYKLRHTGVRLTGRDTWGTRPS